MGRNKNQTPTLPKLTPPRVGKIYPRERLFGLLDRVRADHPVIWISAPGGAGKTSLVASWLQQRKLKTLWYQVDAGDGDSASFFYYLGLAAKSAAPRHQQPLPLLTPEYLGDVPTFTRNFFRELFRRLKHDSVLVFDNYQDAPAESRLHEVLHVAMSEVPQGVTLLVLSRVEPPSVLARLRLCDHVACIDWPKLQLTTEESIGIGTLRLGNALTTSSLENLHQRAHGWAAGLVLMLEQSRDGHLAAAPATTDRKLIFDYFAGELLARSTLEEQRFLLKTALLPKFTAAMAQTFTGNAHAHAILDDLTRRNYFTVRIAGTNEDSFEYHPLFREFLRARGAEGMAPADLRDLQLQAAQLLETAGDFDDAVALYASAEKFEPIVMLILQRAGVLTFQGQYQVLYHWIALLPQQRVISEPWLLFWEGICLLAAKQQFAPARERFDLAYQGFCARNEKPGELLAWSAIIETYFHESLDFAACENWLKMFSERNPEPIQFPSSEIEARVTTAMLVTLSIWSPRLLNLHQWEERAHRLINSNLAPDARVHIGINLIIHYIWTGAFNEARVAMSRLRVIVAEAELADLTRALSLVLDVTYTWQVDADAAATEQAAQAALRESARVGIHAWDLNITGTACIAALYAGNILLAERHLDFMRQHLNQATRLDLCIYHYSMGCLALLRDDYAQAVVVLHISREYAQSMHHWWTTQIADTVLEYACACADRPFESAFGPSHVAESSFMTECLHAALWADVQFTRGNMLDGTRLLTNALAYARRQGIHYFIFWNPKIMARLCARALLLDIETDYVLALIHKHRLLPPNDFEIVEHWPYPLKLYTLGRFSLVRDGAPLHSGGKAQKKPLELLKALIAAGGREVSAAQLMEWLWPQSEGDAASQAYHVTLKRLRGLIGDAALIQEGGRLTLNPDLCWCDVWVLERIFGKLDAACESHPVDALAAAVLQLLALVRGPFLTAERDLAWALGAQERLRVKLLRGLTAAARRLAEAGHTETATAAFEKALDIDPLTEPAYQGLMKIYAASGLPSQTLTVYERCRHALQSGLGVTPSAATEALARLARAG